MAVEADHARQFVAQVAAEPGAEETRSVLEHAYTALSRADYEEFGTCLTEDVELRISGFGSIDGHWVGRAQVVEAAKRNYGRATDQRPVIDSMIAEENAAAVLFREDGVFVEDGRPYSMRAVQWFALEGGKISRIDQIVACL